MLIDCTCTICVSRDGYSQDVQFREWLDTSKPLRDQVHSAALEWADRENRIVGHKYRVEIIRPTTFFYDGRFLIAGEWPFEHE